MKNTLIPLFVFMAASQLVVAQQYQLTGKAYRATFSPPGSWDGQHTFPEVYCVKFPSPKTAKDLAYAYYNRAIFLSDVVYPENLIAAIAVSSIPPGRTAEFEVSRLANVERQAERNYKVNYNVTEFKTAFGPTVGLRINNVADRGNAGPFPLVRALYSSPAEHIHSMSVHRLFVRGLNRFEIAVVQLAKQPTNTSTEPEMARRLTKLADEMVASLQSCTAMLPSRKLN